MLQTTRGIVLRAIKYGESSLVVTIFTHSAGMLAFMVQGVRTAKTGRNRAAYFQPGMLLEMVVQQQPQKNMQRIREYSAGYIYTTLHQEVIKNSISLFSLEILLRLLPEHAPLPSLFDMAWNYFMALDKATTADAANYPLYFIICCSRELGYDLTGVYSESTPYLDMKEGGFTAHAPSESSILPASDIAILSALQQVNDYNELHELRMGSDTRARITDWFVTFLQMHTQHMGNIKSLTVLRTILH